METPKKKSSGTFWMFLPLVLLVTSVSGWLVMVSIAVDDPGFAVEPDYYKKASNFDEVVAQRGENRRLGYQVTLHRFVQAPGGHAILRLKVVDEVGNPLDSAAVTVDAVPVARAFDLQSLVLSDQGDGEYETVVARPRPGLWEIRLFVTQGADNFTQILRPELKGPVLAAGDPPS